ncbi:MAG: hypothetical protein KME31_24675 [Tolypothrix carrinoi HA7290-LM1]|nr:hypothetical protein [Tolypothrix carrinoi HA7290-LM1]
MVIDFPHYPFSLRVRSLPARSRSVSARRGKTPRASSRGTRPTQWLPSLSRWTHHYPLPIPKSSQ